MNDVNNVDVLLQTVGSLISEHRKNMNNISKRGEAFNVFRLCGIDHYEVWHSKILAEFLNPRGSHGQGSLFLQAFFEMLGLDWNPENARVSTEVSSKIGDEAVGRLDIFIEGSDYGIVIENKLFAAEQYEQLERYSKWLCSKYKDKHCLIFLTPNGRKGMTAIDKHRTLSYLKNAIGDAGDACIDKWLRECQKIATDAPFVRETIAQYSNHIKDVIQGGVGMENEISKSIKNNPEAAQLVFENYRNNIVQMANKLMGDILGSDKVSGGCDYNHRESGFEKEYHIGKTKVVIFVGFEGTSLSGGFVGVRIKDFRDAICQNEKWEMPKDWTSEIKGAGYSSNEWWPIWRPFEEKFGVWDGKFFQNMDVECVENDINTAIGFIITFVKDHIEEVNN